MGREIRRVPRGWEHPQNDHCPHNAWAGQQPHANGPKFSQGKCFRPCYDIDYQTAATKWEAEYEQWKRGEHEAQQGKYKTSCKYFWEYNPPPDEDSCRPAFTSDPTCYQVYETVSEGTPISPVFETLAELADYLVSEGYSRAAAEAFCRMGSVPSMVFIPGVGIYKDIESAEMEQTAQTGGEAKA